jgi:predicted Zn-ribbon and HTH transcriptional regulator
MQDVVELEKADDINEIFSYCKALVSNIGTNLKSLAMALYYVRTKKLYKQYGTGSSFHEFCNDLGISVGYATKLTTIVKNQLTDYLNNYDVEKVYMIAKAKLPLETKQEIIETSKVLKRQDIEANIEEATGNTCTHEEQTMYIDIKCNNCSYKKSFVVRSNDIQAAIIKLAALEFDT